MKTTANALMFVGMLWASHAGAAIMTYSERSAWRTAAGFTTLDDLNDLASASSPLATQSVDAGDFTISTSGGWSITFSNTTIDGTIGANASTSARFTLAFTFDQAINAFGLDVRGWNDDEVDDGVDVLRTAVFADSVNVPVTTQEDQGVRFFGFTFPSAFRSVSFAGVPGVSGDAWSFDNVAYSSSKVSAPATFVLLGIGLGALGARLHRKS